MHVALRSNSVDQVEAFYAAALAQGGRDDGSPGIRCDYASNYFAAFVRDPDGNRIEAVTFVECGSGVQG